MAGKNLTNAKRRLLEHLKRAGPSTAPDLALALELTDVAVRQHLQSLQELALVEQAAAPVISSTPASRGRPPTAWALTTEAESVFPDSHAELAVGLIDAAREAFGAEGVMRLVEVRARDQLNMYREAMPREDAPLSKRVRALARLRTKEGYMAQVVQEKPGVFLLIEHHCPICDAAKACQGLCSAELDVFERVLGKGTRVERVEHLLNGGQRCVYRIAST